MSIHLDRLWYQRVWWRWLLWPLSLLFTGMVLCRRWLYNVGLFRVIKMPIPVIVVGNIAVGGTGKTPFVIALCHALKARGYHPGVVSRGYGGQASRWPQVVSSTSDPRLVGDEPVLIARESDCPVVVAPDRVLAAKMLLSTAHCDVIVSDDGLQHYHLARQLEIVMVDGQRQFGNGWCLPAGPLREPLSRLQSVDLVIETGRDMQIQPVILQSVCVSQPDIPLDNLSERSRVVAVSGIGHPGRFFATLRALGCRFDTRVFVDHHPFVPSDIASIDADIIIMTAKDAIKCTAFADPRCYALQIEGVVAPAVLETVFKRLSEMHFVA